MCVYVGVGGEDLIGLQIDFLQIKSTHLGIKNQVMIHLIDCASEVKMIPKILVCLRLKLYAEQKTILEKTQGRPASLNIPAQVRKFYFICTPSFISFKIFIPVFSSIQSAPYSIAKNPHYIKQNKKSTGRHKNKQSYRIARP